MPASKALSASLTTQQPRQDGKARVLRDLGSPCSAGNRPHGPALVPAKGIQGFVQPNPAIPQGQSPQLCRHLVWGDATVTEEEPDAPKPQLEAVARCIWEETGSVTSGQEPQASVDTRQLPPAQREGGPAPAASPGEPRTPRPHHPGNHRPA